MPNELLKLLKDPEFRDGWSLGCFYGLLIFDVVQVYALVGLVIAWIL